MSGELTNPAAPHEAKRPGRSHLIDRLSTLAASPRGQAMTEYAIISWGLLIGTVTLSKFFLPLLLEAYQFYFDVFNFMMNLPIP